MDSSDLGGTVSDEQPHFYIGQHETKREVKVNYWLLQRAKDLGYDMLTTPITTPQFHSSTLTRISDYFAQSHEAENEADVPKPLIPPLTPEETPLAPSEVATQVIAFTSSWIDIVSNDPVISNVSRQVLNIEVAYAAFCGLGNVVIHGPRLRQGAFDDYSVSRFALAIQECLSIGPFIQIQILLPMSGTDDADTEIGHLSNHARITHGHYNGGKPRQSAFFDSWDVWNLIRSVCKYNPRLSVALTLPKQLPPLEVQTRWFSEPLRLISMPSSSFLKNAKGYPVLSKPHQTLLPRYMQLRQPPWLVLTDVGPISPSQNDESMSSPADSLLSPSATIDARASFSPAANPLLSEKSQLHSSLHSNKDKRPRDPTPHLSYLRHLQRTQPPLRPVDRFGAGYQDYLQSPLQPLADNLESITYEVFEKDPIKYDWYERALILALTDWARLSKPTSALHPGVVVVAVVGAGRGPLVTRALAASEKAKVPISLHAVEKNPNAFVQLQRHNASTWNHRVTLAKSDMRHWLGPLRPDGTVGQVDILVSELLGSFADNELSPECLDGVQRVLNPVDGISIPQSYSAHLTPIAAPKLHSDVLARFKSDDQAHETPYVVMLHAIDYLSTVAGPLSQVASSAVHGQPLPVVEEAWSFTHPLPLTVLAQSQLRQGGSFAAGGSGGASGGDGANEHNERFSATRFECKERGVCHGIAGYFETVLYDGGRSKLDSSESASESETEGKGEEGHESWRNRPVELSTNPVTMEEKSKDMISWFPIFFPIKTPLYFPSDTELQISIWRRTDDRKVWYEWLVEAFTTIRGERIRLGASELHSSKKNGCLM